MNARFWTAFGALAFTTLLAATSPATSIEFNGAAPAFNQPIPATYGSNIVANSLGFITDDGSGATPDVGLAWSGDPSLWEYHTAASFDSIEAQIDTGTTNAVAQLQTGPHSIGFSAPAGIQFQLNSFVIGNASDQTEGSYGFDITLVRDSDSAVVFTYFTPFYNPGDAETVVVNYLGDPGEDFTLKFDRAPADGVTFRSAIDNLSFSQILTPGTASYKLVVNRDSGDLVLKNIGTGAGSIKGYTLQSPGGALDPTAWLSITENYDAGSPGPNQVDPNNNWTIQSEMHTDLSEAELEEGDGASLAGSSSLSLGLGVWVKNPLENDLSMQLALPGGGMQTVAIEYEGNNGNPFEVGDFDFDGNIDVADWLIHNAGRGTDVTGLSAAQSYQLGDIDGSGAIDIADFVGFKTAFEAANGAGSFAAMIGVPEPSAAMLLLAGVIALGMFSAWRRPMKPIQVRPFAAMLCSIGLTGTAQAGLQVHLPFDGNIVDVAGGNATTLIDGIDGSSSFVLGSVGNGIHFSNPVSTATEIDYLSIDYTLTDEGSFALWYTADSLYNYQSIIANSVDANDWEMWVYGDSRARARIQGGANNNEVTRAGVLTDQLYHLAWTWDRDDVDTSQATVNLYFDGALVESKTGDWVDPGNTVFLAGGNGNHGANALFDDFRIYDHPLSNAEITALSEMGPDPLSLKIDRSTGEILLENGSDRPYTIDSYEITSVSGALNSAGWNSFQEQDLEGNGAPGTGNGWEEAGGVNSNQLIESYLTGSSEIADGASISLGNAFAIGGSEDVLFAYHLADGQVISTSGDVSYLGVAASNADFDVDGDVDGGDFLTWQRGNGAAGGLLQGDANGDGLVNGADLGVWQGQFGNNGGAANVAAVPEPSTFLFIGLALAGLALVDPARWAPRRRARSTFHCI